MKQRFLSISSIGNEDCTRGPICFQRKEEKELIGLSLPQGNSQAAATALTSAVSNGAPASAAAQAVAQVTPSMLVHCTGQLWPSLTTTGKGQECVLLPGSDSAFWHAKAPWQDGRNSSISCMHLCLGAPGLLR